MSDNPEISELLKLSVNEACKIAHSTPDLEMMRAALKDSRSTVRAFLAENANIPRDVAFALANDEDIVVRRFAYKSESLTSEDIKSLFQKIHDETSFTTLVKNVNCPPSILERLARSSNYLDRKAAIESPYLDEKLVDLLCRDNARFIRIEAVSHSRAPIETLFDISMDREEAGVVRRHAFSLLGSKLAAKSPKELREIHKGDPERIAWISMILSERFPED